MKEMKTLTVNGEQYEIVDAQAREAINAVDDGLDAILAIQQALIGGEQS